MLKPSFNMQRFANKRTDEQAAKDDQDVARDQGAVDGDYQGEETQTGKYRLLHAFGEAVAQ